MGVREMIESKVCAMLDTNTGDYVSLSGVLTRCCLCSPVATWSHHSAGLLLVARVYVSTSPHASLNDNDSKGSKGSSTASHAQSQSQSMFAATGTGTSSGAGSGRVTSESIGGGRSGRNGAGSSEFLVEENGEMLLYQLEPLSGRLVGALAGW